MELEGNKSGHEKNWLPYNGTVHYWGKVFNQHQSDTYFEQLLHSIDWQHDEAIMFGKKIITKRKVAWYGDQPFEYTYSNVTKRASPWTKELLDIKRAVEATTKETFNACLLNLYHSGEEGMAWHSDGEKDLKKDGAIASVTFGAERKFAFKHKQTKDTVALTLEHGSVLIMKDTTQTFWLHRLPPTKRLYGKRINLTFRTIVT
jgi:alkylated DNA repair dioxygenase AlkB